MLVHICTILSFETLEMVIRVTPVTYWIGRRGSFVVRNPLNILHFYFKENYNANCFHILEESKLWNITRDFMSEAKIFFSTPVLGRNKMNGYGVGEDFYQNRYIHGFRPYG